MLSHRENFYRMVRGERPERFAFDLPCTPPIVDRIEQRMGTRDVRAAFDASFQGVGPRIPCDRGAWHAAFSWLGSDVPADAEIDAWGCAHVRPPAESVGDAYHFRTMLHPLAVVTQRGQLEALPWPNYRDPACCAHMADAVAAIHTAERVATCSLECSLFEHAWYVRGMDNLYMDIAEENGIADFLLDYFTARTAYLGGQAAKAGVDCIGLGDDVGTQRGMLMSVGMWRAHLKPRLARVIASIRAATPAGGYVYVKYHSDGDIRDIIGDLIEIGVDILNPMQPECMPAEQVMAQYRDRLAFWGLIGTQSLMPFGSPADVRSFVSRCAQWHKAGSRMIIAPTHVLEPDVPFENITALVDAIRATTLS